MTFRTQFTKNTSQFSPSGEKTEQDYKLRMTPEGGKKLVPAGKRNIYDKIQAHKDETDVYKILELHDPNLQKQIMDKKAIEALYKNENDVYDLRDTPKDLVQAKQMLVDGEKKFNALPISIKKEFSNNFYEFIQAAKNPTTFNKRLEKFAPKQTEVTSTSEGPPVTPVTQTTSTTTEGGSL